VNGKGVAATQWENVAEAGYQLVYGATADLFVDRHDRYIGFGRRSRSSAAVATSTRLRSSVGTGRVARVYCDCYDTETGALLESDPRQNLKRIMNEVEQELGYTFLCGIEPEMMWMRKTDDPNDADGTHEAWCYHINQFEESARSSSTSRVRGATGHQPHVRGPRGFARPARAQLLFDRGRPHRRQPLDVSSDLRPPRAEARGDRELHAEAVQPASPRTVRTTLHPSSTSKA